MGIHYTLKVIEIFVNLVQTEHYKNKYKEALSICFDLRSGYDDDDMCGTKFDQLIKDMIDQGVDYSIIAKTLKAYK